MDQAMHPCLFKYLELVIDVTCLSLHLLTYDLTDILSIVLCSGTYIGFSIVLLGVIIGQSIVVRNERNDEKYGRAEMIISPIDVLVDMFYSVVGTALHLACGVVLCMIWWNLPRCTLRSMALTCAGLSFLNALIFMIDAGVTIGAANEEASVYSTRSDQSTDKKRRRR